MKCIPLVIIAALHFWGSAVSWAATEKSDSSAWPKWKGVMLFGPNNSKSMFFLSTANEGKFQWVKLGDTFAGFRILQVDEIKEKLELVGPDGQSIQLALEASKVKSAKRTALPREEAKRILLESARAPKIKIKNPQPLNLSVLSPEDRARLDPLPPPQLDISKLSPTERKEFENYLAKEEGTEIISASNESGIPKVAYQRALRREAIEPELSANLTDEDIKEISDALWKSVEKK